MQNDKQLLSSDFGMIGASPAMRRVYELIAKAAATEATVLILGETGTGKELIAKAIHHHSSRCNGPFVAVNCGAIASTLIESELFGYEKGAFSGASQRKDGLFVAAIDGTIFLDEINSTDEAFQVKLLRVLQERQLTPVGGTQPVPVDVRVIAAANQDLAIEVRDDRFRKDLYYRLNVLALVAPPLRDRDDDVILLAEHFLAQYAKRDGKAIKGFASSSIETLRRHSWPGNVRELENIIERAVVWSSVDEQQLLEVGFPELTMPTGSPNVTVEAAVAATLPGGIGNIADIAFNELIKGQPPLLGLRQGSKELGPLAQIVMEGLVAGYRQYLVSDQGQKDFANFGNGFMLTRIGLAERSGRSGESVFNSELRRRIQELLARHRAELETY